MRVQTEVPHALSFVPLVGCHRMSPKLPRGTTIRPTKRMSSWFTLQHTRTNQPQSVDCICILQFPIDLSHINTVGTLYWNARQRTQLIQQSPAICLPGTRVLSSRDPVAAGSDPEGIAPATDGRSHLQILLLPPRLPGVRECCPSGDPFHPLASVSHSLVSALLSGHPSLLSSHPGSVSKTRRVSAESSLPSGRCQQSTAILVALCACGACDQNAGSFALDANICGRCTSTVSQGKLYTQHKNLDRKGS